MATLLRLAKPSRLISAAVFEELFDRYHAAWFDCVKESHITWFSKVLGPAESPFSHDKSLMRFKAAVQGIDFICPGFHSTYLIPRLLQLRNQSGANTRLLFINHSPGAFAYVFGLIPTLLRDGDVIIAPSESSARVITRLAPSLEPFVHKVHHPIEAFPPCQSGFKKKRVCIVTLGRIVPEKLIHRQIEAMALLVNHYGWDAEMIIAGELLNFDTNAPSAYARSLEQKVHRLGLGDRVKFPGVIREQKEKGRLLASSDLMLYLSCTLEEAFPKASVEALAAGIPVVSANWNGFPEIIGSCGVLVDLHETNNRSLDIAALDVARALDWCLNNRPSQEKCRDRAALFGAGLSKAGYVKVVDRALTHTPFVDLKEVADPVGPAGNYMGEGMLATVPIFSQLSLKTVLTEYQTYAGFLRRKWETNAPLPDDDAGYNTDILVSMTLKKRLEHLYAGISYKPENRGKGTSSFCPEGLPFFERMVNYADQCEDEDYINAVLTRLTVVGETHVLSCALESCITRGVRNRTVAYAETFLLIHQEKPKQALERFNAEFGRQDFQEHEWPLLLLLKRIVGMLETDDHVLPTLRKWLDRYPDSLGSGLVWLDYAFAVGDVSGWDDPVVSKCLVKAGALLGTVPGVAALEGKVMAASVATDSSDPRV